MPEPPVFERGERVRVLACTSPGKLPRLATSCGEAVVVSFDEVSREYAVKPLAMFSRVQTKILEAYVVPPSRDGADEMNSRGGNQSSEATKVINGLSQKVQKLTVQLEQAQVQIEREQKKAKGAQAKVADGLKVMAALQAEAAALYTGDRCDPRLTHRGRLLAKALTKEGEAVVVREQRRTEAAERATRRALKRLRLVEGKLERENLLKKNALKRAREADAVGAKDSACKKAKEDSKVPCYTSTVPPSSRL